MEFFAFFKLQQKLQKELRKESQKSFLVQKPDPFDKGRIQGV
jgi:hypothetical protein